VALEFDNGRVYIALDERTGSLTRLAHALLGISLLDEPRLAESFRLLLPLPGLRGHYIDGRDQRPSSAQVTASGLELAWDVLTSDEGTFDLRVRQTIDVTGDTVTFGLEIANDTPYLVEEAQSPILGGLTNEAERDDWILQWHQASMARQRRFYAEFPHPGLGAERPTLMHPVDSLPWCDLFHPGRRCGVYLGVHDPEPHFSVLVDQLSPNHAHPARWPEPDEVDDGEAIGATLGWAHFPFIPPGGSWTSPPVVAHFHEGTWYAAADFYRDWFAERFPLDKGESWLYHEDAWQSTIISYPDDTVLFRFSDLPQLARDAKSYGINVIQIDGWDVGGIDRGFPEYEPDPRLGTREELVLAIADCQAAGVRFLMFANVQSVNTETELFRESLEGEVARDAYGNPSILMGWGYHTVLGYLGPAAPKQVAMRTEGAFQEHIVEALSRLVDLGIDGLQLDKTSLDPLVDYRAGADSALAYRRGLVTIMESVKQRGQDRNAEFRLATEGWLDRLVPIADAAYTRVFEQDHVPALEYTFPEYRLTNCLMGVDFSLANTCIRFGHIINFECDNLHGSTASRRRLAEYVAELLRLRRGLADILWYGRIAEPLGIHVSDERVGHTLWRGREGRSALVLTHTAREEVALTVQIDELKDGLALVHQPFQPASQFMVNDELRIPKNRLIVLEWREAD
jgi:hypothetical protein